MASGHGKGGAIVKAQFTPGPLEVNELKPGQYSIDKRDPELPTLVSGVGLAWTKANAELFAAAPEFYEACRLFVKHYDEDLAEDFKDSPLETHRDRMAAALAKAARGQS